MRVNTWLLITLSSVFSALFIAACSYETPRSVPTTNTGGAGGAGGAGGSAGSGGTNSSASTASSSESSSSSGESSSSSSGNSMDLCGNGVNDPGEECDDSNKVAGDGCDVSCKKENHDGCDVPVLEVNLGTTSITGSTTGATDDIKGIAMVEYCTAGISNGPDLIYAVKAMAKGNLTVTMSAQYDNHVLHVRTDCPGDLSTETGCDNDFSAGNKDVSHHSVNAGDVLYVIPDGFVSGNGMFTLELNLQ